MMSDLGLEGIFMQKKSQVHTKKKSRLGVLILLVSIVCGSMITLAYAQSILGSAFNLNSPASFPVDI